MRILLVEDDAPLPDLTAFGEVSDRIDGLELGADEYLAKPFGLGDVVPLDSLVWWMSAATMVVGVVAAAFGAWVPAGRA